MSEKQNEAIVEKYNSFNDLIFQQVRSKKKKLVQMVLT